MIVYKVIVCRNSGEKEFYIGVNDSGEFDQKEFVTDEFQLNNDAKVSPGLFFMLDETCVLQLERVMNPSKRILNSITEDMKFDIKDIKTFKSCAECNKKGMSLMLSDGTMYYPENSEDFEQFEGKYIKVRINGDEVYAFVSSYKYHTKEHDKDIEYIEGCYSKLDEFDEVEYPIETGRKVKPEILTRKCTDC